MTDDRSPGSGEPGMDADMGGADVTAAELALGLLEGEERAVALRRVLADPDFARAVERWRDHFASLFVESPEVAVPPNLFDRIERSLLRPANDVAPANAGAGPWRGIALGATLVAATLAGVMLLRPLPTPDASSPPFAAARRAPVLVAAIAPVEKGAPVAALYDPQTGDLRVAAAMLAAAGHSAELWVIASDGVPVSLGVLDAHHGRSVMVARGIRTRFTPGSTLAVTVEPVGGSPTGKPTGPVVASGALSLV